MNFTEMPRNILISTRNNNSYKSNNNYNNNLNIPDMEFSEKEGKIKMSLIKGLDFNKLFESENSILLQKVIDNLISSKISNSDYDDIHKPLLFKSFQNILEYLVTKEKRIKNINNNLYIAKDKIIKRTDELEQTLNENKKIIEENSKIKKDKKLKYDEEKKKYEEMKKQKKEKELKENKNINKNINTNINIVEIEKNIKINEIKQDENSNNINNDNEINKKFLCQVCKNKYFLTEEGLESHLFRRHPEVYKNNKKKLKRKKSEQNLVKIYLGEIDKLENYINNLIDIYHPITEKNKYILEIEKMKKENQLNFEKMEKEQKQMSEEVRNSVENFIKRQEEFYNNLLIICGLKKSEEEIKEEKEEKEKQINKAIKESIISKSIIKDLKEKIKELKKMLKKQNIMNNLKYKNNMVYLKQHIGLLKKQYLSIIPEIYDSKIIEEYEEDEKEEEEEEEDIKIIDMNSEKNKEEEEKEEEEEEENKIIKESKSSEISDTKKNITILNINRVKKTAGDENEKEIKNNIKFLNNILNADLNPNQNKNNDKLLYYRQLNIKRDKMFNTNKFISNNNNNINN